LGGLKISFQNLWGKKTFFQIFKELRGLRRKGALGWLRKFWGPSLGIGLREGRGQELFQLGFWDWPINFWRKAGGAF